MSDRMRFFSLSDDKLYYDERKKRFVFLEDAPIAMENAYAKSFFKKQRPDMYGQQSEDFNTKLKYGQMLIRQMNYQTKLEMRRLWRQMAGMSYMYFYPLLDDFMAAQAVDRPRNLRLWTWQDSTKIVNFVNMHLMQAHKYGLDIPIQNQRMTKEQLKEREDQLTAYFLHEMRKAPLAQKA